jgi:hypothetical protein
MPCDCIDCMNIGVGLELHDMEQWLVRYPLYDEQGDRRPTLTVYRIIKMFCDKNTKFHHEKTGLDAFL